MNARYCVVGVGAIGGTIAARLAAAGESVSLVERARRREQLQRDGLRFVGADGHCIERRLPVADAAQHGPQDIVFVAVKAHALPQALAQLKPLLHEHTLVVGLVNGIPWWYGQNNERCGGKIPARQIVGTVFYTTARCTEDGRIVATSEGRLVLGWIDGRREDKVLDSLGQTLRAAGINCTLSEEIRADVWTKVAVNLATNPLSVVTQTHLKALFTQPDLLPVVEACLIEAIAVARAWGVEPSVSLETMLTMGASQGHVETSMLQDYRRGRPLELNGIADSVLRMAAERAIPVPVTRSIVHLAAYLASAASLTPRAIHERTSGY